MVLHGLGACQGRRSPKMAIRWPWRHSHAQEEEAEEARFTSRSPSDGDCNEASTCEPRARPLSYRAGGRPADPVAPAPGTHPDSQGDGAASPPFAPSASLAPLRGPTLSRLAWGRFPRKLLRSLILPSFTLRPVRPAFAGCHGLHMRGGRICGGGLHRGCGFNRRRRRQRRGKCGSRSRRWCPSAFRDPQLAQPCGQVDPFTLRRRRERGPLIRGQAHAHDVIPASSIRRRSSHDPRKVIRWT